MKTNEVAGCSGDFTWNIKYLKKNAIQEHNQTYGSKARS